MKLSIQGQGTHADIIRELLSPWDVSFTNLNEADVAIVYGEKPLDAKKTVVIPSYSSDFLRKSGEQVSVAVSSQTTLTIKPQALYHCRELDESTRKCTTPFTQQINQDQIFLTLDVVNECVKILDATLNAKPSKLYRLLTGFPVPYSIAPEGLRDLLMKSHRKGSLTLFDKLPLDALRFILVRAIETLAGEDLPRKTWNGKRYAFMLTHDVETRSGLRRAKQLKRIEHNYNVPSTWFIPSKRYKLDADTIRELANSGEVGVHGTKHDGKLNQTSETELVEKLLEAKQTLERVTRDRVEGFRAPLLQHNVKIIRCLRSVGYVYDTSIPTWEPRHPNTMSPHGIATVYPLTLEGLTEFSVTLPQDHQLLSILSLSPKEAISSWINMIDTVKELGGLCTILVHPDHKLGDPENRGLYEEFLNATTSDKEAFVSLPRNIVSTL